MITVLNAVGSLPTAPQSPPTTPVPQSPLRLLCTCIFVGGLLLGCWNLLFQCATVQIKQNQQSNSWPLACERDEVIPLILLFTKLNQLSQGKQIPISVQLLSPIPILHLSVPFYRNSLVYSPLLYFLLTKHTWSLPQSCYFPRNVEFKHIYQDLK